MDAQGVQDNAPIGCAFSGISHKRGQIGNQFARLVGGDGATILASGERASSFGAAFANAEAINALDFDAVLPPGHVSPYVLPPALATAEEKRSSGNDFIVAIALAHEISNRIGKAMTTIAISKTERSSRQASGVLPAPFSAARRAPPSYAT